MSQPLSSRLPAAFRRLFGIADPPVDPESREGKLAYLAEGRINAAKFADPDRRFYYLDTAWGNVGYTLTAADFTDAELIKVADDAYLAAYADVAAGGDGARGRLKARPAVLQLAARDVNYTPPAGPTPFNSATEPPTPPHDPSRGR